MDPENNNPLTNPSAPADDNSPAVPVPDIDSMMTGDSMTAAADTLTSAGLAADTGADTLNLDQIGATQPEAVMTPPVEEPLVPAAPVPGSIGSVTSVPAEPEATADATAGVAYPTNSNPDGQSFGAAEPETTGSGPLPAPEVAPQMPYNPFSSSASASKDSAPAPVNPAFQPEAPKKEKKPMVAKNNIPLILVSGIAVVLLIVAIIFFSLWRQAVNNPKIVYVPTVSEDQVNSRIELLNCSREEDYSWLIDYAYSVPGTQTVVASYTNGELRTLSIDYNAAFNTEADATVARGTLAANQAATLSAAAGSFTSEYSVNGTALAASIQSADSGIDVNDAMTVVYGEAEGHSASLDSLRNFYTENGFACVIE